MNLSASEIYQKILDLRTQDEMNRIAAIRFIPAIASALGASRTCDEFLPYIVETAVFSEDQWISVLEAIGKIDYSKLLDKQINNVFYSICSICEMESRAIREAFIKCFVSIVNSVKSDACDTILKDMIFTMMAQEESPSIRAAAISVYANTISKFSPQIKSSLFMKIELMKADPAANVRQAYASSASLMAPFLKGALLTNLLSSMAVLAKDESYSVCCEVPSFLSVYMKVNNNSEKVFEIGEALLESDNWRVRCVYISALSDIFKGQTVSFDQIFPILLKGSEDNDDEVKTAVAEDLPFLASIPNPKSSDLQKLIESLIKCTCAHVRTSTAKALPDFADIVDSKFVCEGLIDLTQDKSQEVKITAIESLKSPKVPLDVKLNCLSKAAETTEWREKESIVKLLPELSLHTNNDYKDIVIKMLKDDSCKVRNTIIEKLPILVSRKGSNLKNDLGDTFKEMTSCNDYQLRQTAITAIIKIEMFDPVFIQILEKAVEDPVCNVRLVLAENIPKTDKFKSILEKLKKDDDEDVRSYIP